MNHNRAFNFLGLFILITPLNDYRRITYYGEPTRKFAGYIKTGNRAIGHLRLFHFRNFGILIHKATR